MPNIQPNAAQVWKQLQDVLIPRLRLTVSERACATIALVELMTATDNSNPTTWQERTNVAALFSAVYLFTGLILSRWTHLARQRSLVEIVLIAAAFAVSIALLRPRVLRNIRKRAQSIHSA